MFFIFIKSDILEYRKKKREKKGDGLQDRK